jgi:hypothetical protein
MLTLKNNLLASAFILLCGPALLHAADETANELNTDWLEATAGSSSEQLGAKVVQVKQMGEMTVVDVDIPAKDLQNYETVLVIGKRQNLPVSLPKHPILLSRDGEHYGLRIEIKGLPGYEFRLQLRDNTEELIK